jgi:hypothetical protein
METLIQTHYFLTHPMELMRLYRTAIQNRKSKISSVALGIALALAAAPHAGAEQQVDHAGWDALLRAHVNSEGLVDYAALGQQRAALEAYLTTLADADVASLPRDEQLAFWINAYNACVVKGVLEHYPIKSVKEVRGFFDTIRYQVGGRLLALNEIEVQSRALGEWRIHRKFARANFLISQAQQSRSSAAGWCRGLIPWSPACSRTSCAPSFGIRNFAKRNFYGL